MSKKINIALFGFGRIGQMHAENLTKNKEIKLLYVYEKINQLNKNTLVINEIPFSTYIFTYRINFKSK